MAKIHTRRKRKKGVTTSFRHRFLFTNPSKKKGQKTFKNEEALKAYADKMGIKNYKIENLKSPESSTQKLRIVYE